MSKELDIEVIRRGPCSVIEVKGELDSQTSPRFSDVVRQALGQAGVREVIVDLGGTRKVDSSGLANLLEGWREAGRRGAHFVLTGLNDRLKRLLDTTRLAGVFEIANREEVRCLGHW